MLKLPFENNTRILAIDPSGDGTTGIGVCVKRNVEFYEIKKMNYDTQNDYFCATEKFIFWLIKENKIQKVIIEDFIIYAGKVNTFTYNTMPTIRLVAILEHNIRKNLPKVELTIQKAAIHKATCDNRYLNWHFTKKELKGLSNHKIDSLRMIIHTIKSKK